MPQLDLNDFLPYRLSRSAALISRKLRAIYRRKYGLTVPEWRCLAILGTEDNITASHICQRTDMHKTKVSRAIQKLARMKVVMRVENPTDRRSEFLSLTPRGKSLFNNIVPEMLAFEARLANALNASDINHIITLLNRLDKALANFKDG